MVRLWPRDPDRGRSDKQDMTKEDLQAVDVIAVTVRSGLSRMNALARLQEGRWCGFG
jgi:hypothetical protein